MTDIKTIEPKKYNKLLAEALKKLPEFKQPEWSVLVKTSTNRKRPSTEEDFWHKRAASILRFIYVNKDSKYWNNFFDLLIDWNKIWCKNASSLIILISRKNNYHNNGIQITHSLEAGMAFQNLALEGTDKNIVVHGMAGFDYDNAKKLLKLNDNWQVECMIAIGKKAEKETLPKEFQEKEIPSDRLKINQIALEFKGDFKDINPYK